MNERHPMDQLLREDRIPHIWCSGCGLGTCLTAFITAIQESGIPLEKMCIVSGIGCTGRVAGYLNIDSFHTCLFEFSRFLCSNSSTSFFDDNRLIQGTCNFAYLR